jgi:hypothetical protein
LSEGYDRESETWRLNEQLLPLLEETLRRFANLSPDGFAFQSLWSDEKPLTMINVSMTDILNIVRENRVGKRCRYNVRPQG